MRVLLFLAIFGVVAGGVALTSNNMAAEAFGPPREISACVSSASSSGLPR